MYGRALYCSAHRMRARTRYIGARMRVAFYYCNAGRQNMQRVHSSRPELYGSDSQRGSALRLVDFSAVGTVRLRDGHPNIALSPDYISYD